MRGPVHIGVRPVELLQSETRPWPSRASGRKDGLGVSSDGAIESRSVRGAGSSVDLGEGAMPMFGDGYEWGVVARRMCYAAICRSGI